MRIDAPNIMLTFKNISIDRVLISALYLMVILFPLTFYGTIEVGVTVKLYEVVAVLGFGLLLIDRVKKRDFSWRKTPLDIPLLGFWIVTALSLTQAINIERGIAWWLWLSLYIFAIYYLIINLVKEERHVKGLLKTYVITAAVISAFALVQLFLDWAGFESLITPGYSKFGSLSVPRPHATLKEPLLLGNYLLVPAAFIAVSFLSKKTLFFRTWVEGSLLLLFSVANIVTLSRGSIVSMGGGLILLTLGYLALRVFNPQKFKAIFAPLWPRFFGFIVVLMLAFPVFLGMSQVGLWLESVTLSFDENIEDKRARAVAETDRLGLKSPRWRDWDRAWQMFKENPVLGVGWANFGPVKIGVSETITGPDQGFAIVNNEPLEVAAETGVVGLLFYLGFNTVFVWCVVLGFWRSLKEKLYTWVLLFAGFLLAFLVLTVQFLTFSTIQIGHFWFVLGLGTASIVLFKRDFVLNKESKG